ncbi:hypothetical protein SLE2022_165090 [Rubroshorea leprosula]
MVIEKEGSRGGGYVGGFLQLFDWTAKSRKKLFSSKSDFPEHLKQGKKSDGNLPMTQFHLIDEDEIGVGSSVKGISDYSCASSVTDDDIYGVRAPGVVARLMGLDSLPTSSSELYSTPLFDTQSLRSAQYHNKNLYCNHDQQMVHPGNLSRKVDGPVKNFVESKPQKIVSRPIEKFQSESLPPKSAKSIPITHHKLLSPIKSPGFVPIKNAAHIMEAAARIIESSPQVATRAKMPLVGSSSVPLKVRDLKEKIEAAQKMPPVGSASVSLKVRDLKQKAETVDKTSRLAESTQRPVESNAAKYLKGQSLNKSWNGSTDMTSLGASDAEEGSSRVKNKGKSISLAIQAKVNVQKREGLSSSGSKSLLCQRDQSEVKSSQTFKSQPNSRKNLHKKSSTPSDSGALRQNNQKQNCLTDKDKISSRPMGSNMQSRKDISSDSSFGRQKTSRKTVQSSKTGSRKLGLDVTDNERGGPYSGTKKLSRKKRSIDGEFHSEKNEIINNMLIGDRSEKKSVQSNADRHFSWVEDSKKKGMDVVSFTFTAPLTRPMETSAQIAQRSNNNCMNNQGRRLLLDTESMKLSSLGYNMIGGDALSMLLEQKLRELSNAVESSSHESLQSGSLSSSTSILHNLVESPSVSSAPRFYDKLNSCSGPSLSSTDLQELQLKHKFQGVDEMDECSSSQLDAWQPSPVSVLEPSFSTESCNSSDSMDCSIMEGSKQSSSVQAQGLRGLCYLKKLHTLEADTELSDSASSSSIRAVDNKTPNAVKTDSMKLIKWELEYVKLILCNVELMFNNFALGRAREIISPHLLDQLENQKTGLRSNSEESRLQRKVLFDCVSECLDLRCRRYIGGGCRMWAKGMAMLRRKEWLAEEVYKEISQWRGMGDCMVDELVDKDMSSQYGKWQDFEVDAFLLGSEVEDQIFNALVDEVVADILQF